MPTYTISLMTHSRIIARCATGFHAHGALAGNRDVRARLRLIDLSFIVCHHILLFDRPITVITSRSLPFCPAIAMTDGGAGAPPLGGEAAMAILL